MLDLDDDGEIEHQFGRFETAQVADEARTFFELDDEDRVRRRERGVDGAVRDGPRVDATAPRRRFPRDVERSAVRAAIARRVPPRVRTPCTVAGAVRLARGMRRTHR